MNEIKEKFITYLPRLLQQRQLIIHLLIVMILLFFVSMITSHVVLSYHDKQEKEAQIITMKAFLDDWKSKSDMINAAAMRPVNKNQVDMVQTEILFAVQTYQLNLVSMKDVQKGVSRVLCKFF